MHAADPRPTRLARGHLGVTLGLFVAFLATAQDRLSGLGDFSSLAFLAVFIAVDLALLRLAVVFPFRAVAPAQRLHVTTLSALLAGRVNVPAVLSQVCLAAAIQTVSVASARCRLWPCTCQHPTSRSLTDTLNALRELTASDLFSFLGTGVPQPVPIVGRGPWVGCGFLFGVS